MKQGKKKTINTAGFKSIICVNMIHKEMKSESQDESVLLKSPWYLTGQDGKQAIINLPYSSRFNNEDIFPEKNYYHSLLSIKEVAWHCSYDAT